MENLVFLVIHHATEEIHTNMLIRCIHSIRNHYPTNTLLVCKTSTSNISEDITKKYNIQVHNTPCDGSHIYGGMLLLSQLEFSNTTNYVLIHDSMILRKKLPDCILMKNFYSLWHFHWPKNEEHQYNYILDHLHRSKFTLQESLEIINLYKNDFLIKWYGLFGPAFGGNMQSLRYMIDKINLNIETISYFCGRREIEIAERYIPLIALFLKIHETFPDTYSLDGNIYDQLFAWDTTKYKLSFEDITTQIYHYNSYFFKTWVGRS